MTASDYGALEKLLQKHGFLIYELLTPDEIQRDATAPVRRHMKE